MTYRGIELQPWQRSAVSLMMSGTRVWIERPRCCGREISMNVSIVGSELPPLRVLKRRFESRMDARGVMTLATETREWIAAFLRAAGVRPKCSTSIADTLTSGYGRLDEFGSWEFPL